jgi:hypothetical protein
MMCQSDAAVALDWGEARVLNGVSEDFEAMQRQLRLFGFVSQLVAVILSGVFLFFGWMAFRHELSLPLLLAPLGEQCLTVAKVHQRYATLNEHVMQACEYACVRELSDSHLNLQNEQYVPKELYLFLFLTGQVGKRLALVAKAGFEWWVRVKRILAAKRHLRGNTWARVAKDVATLRFAEYVFVLLFLVDSLGTRGCTRMELRFAPPYVIETIPSSHTVSKEGTENHACAEVAAYLLACEVAALLLNLAVTFPNRYIRQALLLLPSHVSPSCATHHRAQPTNQDFLTGITEAALFALMARFMWGGDARLALLSLPILLFRLTSVASLLRPTLVSLLGPKEKSS